MSREPNNPDFQFQPGDPRRELPRPPEVNNDPGEFQSFRLNRRNWLDDVFGGRGLLAVFLAGLCVFFCLVLLGLLALAFFYLFPDIQHD